MNDRSMFADESSLHVYGGGSGANEETDVTI